MPNIHEYYQQISLSNGLSTVCTHLCNRTFSVFRAISGKVIQCILVFLKNGIIQANYTRQNGVHPQAFAIYEGKYLHILEASGQAFRNYPSHADFQPSRPILGQICKSKFKNRVIYFYIIKNVK